MKKTLYVLSCALCTLLVLPAAAQVPSYVPTDGLVGWWPFNGNANDESGNGNDGTLLAFNGMSYDVNNDILSNLSADRFGNNLSALGTFQYASNVSIPISNTIFEADFTISIWAKNDSVVSQYPTILESENFNFIIQYGNTGGPISVGSYMSGLGVPPFNGVGSIVNYSDWTLITVINQENTSKLYLNGTLVATANDPSSQETTGSSYIRVGNGIQLPQGVFYGSVDDIAIYNRALTEQEIQNLYTGQCPTVSTNCTSLPSNLQQGLVGYWPFCGNANDESGNGNDGVVNGATLTEDRFGNANAAYGFDGVNNYIIAGPQLPLGNSNRSHSLWVNFYSLPSPGEGYCALAYGSNVPNSFQGNSIGIWNNTPIVTWRYSGYGVPFIDYPAQIELDNWYHLVASIDNSIAKLYLNGELISESDASSWNTVESDLLIGRLLGIDDFMHGRIDDIGIWNRALTPEEVQELYTLDACTLTVYDTLTVYETVYDTVYTYETIYDTVTTYVTVTDTLLIDITFVGFEGQPSWLNTVTVFPNPASDHITIDYGNFALMAGYNTIITDAAGATVYSSAVNSQQVEIDINAWGATGVYYMSIYDANGELVAVRHIVLE